MKQPSQMSALRVHLTSLVPRPSMNCVRHSRKIVLVTLSLVVVYVLWTAVSLEKRSAKSLVSKGLQDSHHGEDVDVTTAAVRHLTTATTGSVRTIRVVKPSPSTAKAENDPLVQLRRTISELNAKETVLNAAKFPPLTDDGLVILVQVHKRLEYLRHLLRSLQEAKGVENVLLILSHDYYDEGINGAVQEITFCKVSLRIYF